MNLLNTVYIILFLVCSKVARLDESSACTYMYQFLHVQPENYLAYVGVADLKLLSTCILRDKFVGLCLYCFDLLAAKLLACTPWDYSLKAGRCRGPRPRPRRG